jgi:murein DD-endopeptidase MepM/ murein hydrolase activator NlpD
MIALLAFAIGCASGAPRRTPQAPPQRTHGPPQPAPDLVHVVQRGETVYRLSKRYGVSVDAIVRRNGIRDVSSVPVGARLVIPGVPGHGGGAPRGAGDLADVAYREASLAFGWPLNGRFSSGFGRRGRRSHDGIDIAARTGTPVRAAEAGRVTHSGWLGDYGRVVIVKHAGHYSTVYAHNRTNKVRKGAFVEKGQLLAEVGSSGNASGPHLHFEIRRDRKPENPLRFLPGTVPASQAAAQ